MKSGWMKKSLCLACLALSVGMTAIGMGQTAVGGGPSGAPSMMERVQRVDDPELADMIRTALANHKNLSEKDGLEIVRRVTQSYAQIKLLDQQIQQVTRKIEATAGPAEVREELVFAKKELELKRMTEMANLREAMAVVPKFPFSTQPIKTCNTNLHINVIDQRAYVTDGVKPFEEYWALQRFKSLELLSESEVVNLVRGRLKDKNNLPARIEVLHTAATTKTAQGLRDAIINAVCEINAEMQTEVSLTLMNFVGSGESPFFLREGKVRTLYPVSGVSRPDGGPKLLTSGLVDPNDIEQSILWRLTRAKNVPLRFRIEYDEASAKLAKQVADTAKGVAKRLGIAELVEVTGALVEPVPETAFLGRWQADMQGEMQTIDVQPRGICQVTMGKGTEAIKGGANVSGTWFRTVKEIVIDIKDHPRDKGYSVYRGSINAEGNLVVDRGEIFPQGSFHVRSLAPTVFKKMY